MSYLHVVMLRPVSSNVVTQYKAGEPCASSGDSCQEIGLVNWLLPLSLCRGQSILPETFSRSPRLVRYLVLLLPNIFIAFSVDLVFS